METTLVVMAHPDGDEDHPVVLANGQKIALRKTLHLLDNFVGSRQVAVLTSSAVAVGAYAKSVAGHFIADDPVMCEGLLRDSSSGHIDDGLECIDDYIAKPFGLVVVIVSKDIAEKWANLLSRQYAKPYHEIRTPGMTNVYVI